jgi:hypothetical protein
LVKIKEVLEALIALEVEFRVIGPNVLADLEGDEEIEDVCFALDGLKRTRAKGCCGIVGKWIGGVGWADKGLVDGKISRPEYVHTCCG